jgi:nucleoside-diphosphate-sugar epimerase
VTPDAAAERAAPGRVVDVNLGGSVNVLEAARASPNVERVLLVSSSAVYGAPAPGMRGPQGEDGPLQPGSMYAAAKRAAELIASRYATAGRAEVAALRPASLYGPMERPTGSRAHMSAPWQLLEALRAGREVRLCGANVRCDWTHVSDAAEAVRRLLAAPRWSHAVYNLGSGEAPPLGDVAAAFEATGLRVRWVDDPAGADIGLVSEQERAPLDIGRLRDDAGYRPAYVGAAGVARWLRELG